MLKLRILLVDDRLGFLGTAKFFEAKLNQLAKKVKLEYEFEVLHERYITNLDLRFKTERIDLILLDLVFVKNKDEKKEDLEVICQKCPKLKNEWCKKAGKKLKLEKVSIGECAIEYIIRPNIPAIPLIIFTSKTGKKLYKFAAKWALDQKAFLDKKVLKNRTEEGFKELINIIELLITKYKEGFYDKIEIVEDRREEGLDPKNRDYMQTRLWQILAEKIKRKVTEYQDEQKEKNEKELTEQYKRDEHSPFRFAVAFFDIDGMKRLNDTYGYQRTNEAIKNFVHLISKKIKAKKKDNAILGHYFRERGDEFVICWDNIKSKETAINNVEQIIEYLNKEETQKNIFTFRGQEEKERPFKVTASFGLFVYPDDLRWNEWRTYSSLKEIEVKDLKKFTEDVFKQITEIPLKLKDNAKELGKNQACYYQIDRSPRVNVLINSREEQKQALNKLFEFIFGRLAFEFISVDKKESHGRCIHAQISIRKDQYLIISSNNGEYKYPEDNIGIQLKEFFDKYGNYYEHLFNSENKEKRDEALKTHSFMREIYKGLFHVIRKLAREHYRYEKYHPKVSIKREILSNFNKLKEEVIFFKECNFKPTSCGANKLKDYYEGINILSTRHVWASERPSNKEVLKGDDREAYKHSLILELQVKPIAYGYLMIESGRNMLKFQQFIEGYFKGFLEMNPDAKNKNEIIDLLYWDDLKRREEEKKKRIILCRHELFSPVDPIVYNELVEIHRVRIDFHSENEDLSEYSASLIDHMTLSDAKKAGMIIENSIIDKFVKNYFVQEADIDLVIYCGSEMIGPSVQMAEVAGYITEKLRYACGNTFLLFDLFSGSSATSLPSFRRLYEWIKKDSTKKKKVYVVRLDDKRPGIDYLNVSFSNDNDHESYKNKMFFSSDYYIEASFKFDKAKVQFDYVNRQAIESVDTKRIKGGSTKVSNLVPYSNLIDQYVLKGKNKKKIDLIIADPPHIFSLPFLFRGKENCFAKAISEKTKVFIVYYAHKEQREFCRYIRENLKNKYFKHVWGITVAGEEMAVCTNLPYISKLLAKALSQAKKGLVRDYYKGLQVINYEKID